MSSATCLTKWRICAQSSFWMCSLFWLCRHPCFAHHPIHSFPFKCICYYGDRKIVTRGEVASMDGAEQQTGLWRGWKIICWLVDKWYFTWELDVCNIIRCLFHFFFLRFISVWRREKKTHLTWGPWRLTAIAMVLLNIGLFTESNSSYFCEI